MSDLLDWFVGKWDELVALFWEILGKAFDWMWGVVKDAAGWVFESLLNLVIYALDQIDLSGIQGVEGLGSLPGEVLNVLGLLGAGEASGIILAAVGIRLVLQLVPFTRLGS